QSGAGRVALWTFGPPGGLKVRSVDRGLMRRSTGQALSAARVAARSGPVAAAAVAPVAAAAVAPARRGSAAPQQAASSERPAATAIAPLKPSLNSAGEA